MADQYQQIFADFLNLADNHSKVKKAFEQILSDDIILSFNEDIYKGKSEVIQHLEKTSEAISKDFGFRAVPIIICDTNDPEFGFTKDNLYTAVALLSKLETYVSWYFLLRCDENFLINKIIATRGKGYSFYHDIYSEGDFDYSEYQ